MSAGRSQGRYNNYTAEEEKSASSQTKELTAKERQEIAREFRRYDKDGDGYITYREAHSVLEERLGFSKEKTVKLMRMCDRNGDGRLSYDEFIDFFFSVRHKSRELRAVFHEFDRDGNGVISMDEAREAFRNLAFNESEIETMVRAYDANGDGELQYEEFVKLWNAS